MLDIKDLAKLMMVVAESYGNRFEVSERTAAVWHRYLKEFSLEAVTQAFDAHISSCNWPPTPADIRRLIDERRALSAQSAEQSWEQCRELMRRFGVQREAEAMAELSKINPIARHAVQLVTWYRIGMTHYDELHFVQKDFIRNYNMLLERGGRMELLQVEGPERAEAQALLGTLHNKGIRLIKGAAKELPKAS